MSTAVPGGGAAFDLAGQFWQLARAAGKPQDVTLKREGGLDRPLWETARLELVPVSDLKRFDKERDRLLDPEPLARSAGRVSVSAGRGDDRLERAAAALRCEDGLPELEHVIVVDRGGTNPPMTEGRDHFWHDLVDAADAECEPEPMDSEDPLFILYTSGSTAKPKGIQHTTAGYLTGVTATHKLVFDLKDDDVYWCAADIGWVTGHSYIVYGPLANGATTVMYEGTPDWPDKDRFWRIVEKYGVTILYTAPTAIRTFVR